MIINKGERGATTQYYAANRYHTKDFIDGDGQKHFKGDMIRDTQGRPVGDYEWKATFNLEQVDIRSHKWKHDEHGKWLPPIPVAEPFVLNSKPNLPKPFDVEAGKAYTAKDNSGYEKFLESISKYRNACITGTEYKATHFTKDDIENISSTVLKETRKYFSDISDVSLMAEGRFDKLEKIQTRRNEKEQTRENQRPEPELSR